MNHKIEHAYTLPEWDIELPKWNFSLSEQDMRFKETVELPEWDITLKKHLI